MVLGGLVTVAPLTVDMYLPALPGLESQFHAPMSLIQLTLAGYLVGTGIGNLWLGAVSDSAGRRRPLLVSLIVYIVATVGCALAWNVTSLIAFRTVQGAGGAGAGVIAMAIVRDLQTGRDAARTLSRLMIVLGLAPVVAPTLGSLVLGWVGWRAIFVVLAIVGLVLLFAVAFWLRETLPVQERRASGGRAMLRSFAGVSRTGLFWGMALSLALVESALMAYLAGTTFLYQQHFGVSTGEFGALFAGGAICMIVGSQLNSWLLRRYGPDRLQPIVLAFAACLAAVPLIVSWYGEIGLPVAVLGLWGAMSTIGALFANGMAMLLERFRFAAGAAAALAGVLQSLSGAVVSPVVGLIGGSLAVSIVMTACFAAAAVLFVIVAGPGLRRWRSATGESPVVLAASEPSVDSQVQGE